MLSREVKNEKLLLWLSHFCLFVAVAALLGATAASSPKPTRTGQSSEIPSRSTSTLAVRWSTPQGLTTLDQAARTYRDGKPIVMVVSGGTDSTGSAAANLRLSQQRADNVLQGLIARGIPVERFQILAKGRNRAGCTRARGNARSP